MGFFDLPERDPEEDDIAAVDDDPFEDLQPGPWVGGVVPLELVIARSDDAVILIAGLSAFPDGVELMLKSYLRKGVQRSRRNGFDHPMMWHARRDGNEPVPDGFLRFGIAWPDGGRATNLDGWGRSWPDATEPTHGLEAHGGGGSDREWKQEYWVWPLPETGELSIVVEWPAFGIEETVTKIDSAVLVEAAGRAQAVWPEDADTSSHVDRAAMMRAIQQRAGNTGTARPGLRFDL